MTTPEMIGFLIKAFIIGILFGVGWVRLSATAKNESEFLVNKICGTIFICTALLIANV